MGSQEVRNEGRTLRSGGAWGHLGVPKGCKRKRTGRGLRHTEKKSPAILAGLTVLNDPAPMPLLQASLAAG